MGWEACFFWRAKVDLCSCSFVSLSSGEGRGRARRVVIAPILLEVVHGPKSAIVPSMLSCLSIRRNLMGWS